MVLKLTDIPFFPSYIDGQSDHQFMAGAWAQGPFARDKLGVISAFSAEHMAIFTDERWTRQIELEGMRASGVTRGAMFDFVSNSLLFSNGQAHRNRRGPLARSFARPVLAALREDVARRTDRMAFGLEGAGRVDFLRDFAGPLPAQVIASVLGIPENDADSFAGHVYSAIRGLSVVSAEIRAESDADLDAINRYVDDLLAVRRPDEAGDFLSQYLAKTEDGPMSAEEIRCQIVGLVLAGSDTTRGALASTLSKLLQHRDQWEAFCADPDGLIDGVVNEGLRFDPVIGSLPRVTLETREVDGVKFPRQTFVAVSMLTSLRDPQVYADPDRFDVFRSDHPRLHPVFGSGPHRCLGEILARIELEEALKALARHLPHLAMDGPLPVMRGYGAVRSISDLFVSA